MHIQKIPIIFVPIKRTIKKYFFEFNVFVSILLS
nr:MAG TPA: hypothetical protein [Caudoviricetes sp.]